MSNRRKHTKKKAEPTATKKKAVKVASSNSAEFNGLENLENVKTAPKTAKNKPDKVMTFDQMKEHALNGKGNLVNTLRGR